MEALASSEVFLFDDFRLDRRGGGLFRRDESGAFAPAAIGSRGLDILEVLIARAGEVVSKDEIMAGDHCRGQQSDSPDIRAPPGTRPRPNQGELHPNRPRTRLPICCSRSAAGRGDAVCPLTGGRYAI